MGTAVSCQDADSVKQALLAAEANGDRPVSQIPASRGCCRACSESQDPSEATGERSATQIEEGGCFPEAVLELTTAEPVADVGVDAPRSPSATRLSKTNELAVDGKPNVATTAKKKVVADSESCPPGGNRLRQVLAEREESAMKPIVDAPGVDTDSSMTQIKKEKTWWRYTPANGLSIAIRSAPQINSGTTKLELSPGERVCICEERPGDGSVNYLKLNDGRGWIFDKRPGIGVMCVRVEAPPEEVAKQLEMQASEKQREVEAYELEREAALVTKAIGKAQRLEAAPPAPPVFEISDDTASLQQITPEPSSPQKDTCFAINSEDEQQDKCKTIEKCCDEVADDSFPKETVIEVSSCNPVGIELPVSINPKLSDRTDYADDKIAESFGRDLEAQDANASTASGTDDGTPRRTPRYANANSLELELEREKLLRLGEEMLAEEDRKYCRARAEKERSAMEEVLLRWELGDAHPSKQKPGMLVPAVVEFLRKHGFKEVNTPKVSTITRKKSFVLHKAVEVNDAHMLIRLIQAGANLSLHDGKKRSPAVLAEELNKNGSHTEIIKLLNQARLESEIVELTSQAVDGAKQSPN